MNAPKNWNIPRKVPTGRMAALGAIIVVGMAGFDVFNYATTQDAIHSLIGDLALFGLPLAMTLAVAFCAADLGGLASLFTKEALSKERWYIWMLGGAWLIVGLINAWLTHLSTQLAMLQAPIASVRNPIVDTAGLMVWGPRILAVAVYLIRVMLIGAAVVAGNNAQAAPVSRPAAAPVRAQVAAAPTAAAARLAGLHPAAPPRPAQAMPVQGVPVRIAGPNGSRPADDEDDDE